MKSIRLKFSIAFALVLVFVFIIFSMPESPDSHMPESHVDNPSPSLTVTTTSLKNASVPLHIPAVGNIMAWQEAIIGSETNGLRLAEVKVNVGDWVKRGQTLAVFVSEIVVADLDESEAAYSEAEALFTEAESNANRARALNATGALSNQQIEKLLITEKTARARLNALRAVAQKQRIRLAQTKVLAPDDGVISSRTATLGTVLSPGQELFRLIRQNRLEWRADVTSQDISQLSIGQVALVSPNGGKPIKGKLRVIGPQADSISRNVTVYVDIPSSAHVRAGMFARGEFQIGTSQVLTLPITAVQHRNGSNYVFCVDQNFKVTQKAIAVGRRFGEFFEVVSGIDTTAVVVEAGGAFLNDGDQVKVVNHHPLTFSKPSKQKGA